MFFFVLGLILRNWERWYIHSTDKNDLSNDRDGLFTVDMVFILREMAFLLREKVFLLIEMVFLLREMVFLLKEIVLQLIQMDFLLREMVCKKQKDMVKTIK